MIRLMILNLVVMFCALMKVVRLDINEICSGTFETCICKPMSDPSSTPTTCKTYEYCYSRGRQNLCIKTTTDHGETCDDKAGCACLSPDFKRMELYCEYSERCLLLKGSVFCSKKAIKATAEGVLCDESECVCWPGKKREFNYSLCKSGQTCKLVKSEPDCLTQI